MKKKLILCLLSNDVMEYEWLNRSMFVRTPLLGPRECLRDLVHLFSRRPRYQHGYIALA